MIELISTIFQKYRSWIIAFLFITNVAGALLLWSIVGTSATLDTKQYTSLADQILSTGRYGNDCAEGFLPEPVRMPGFPVFLASIFWLFDHSETMVIFVQIALLMASIVLIGSVVGKSFGQTSIFWFLGLTSIYPFLAFSALTIMTEILCTFFVALGIFLFSRKTSVSVAFSGLSWMAATYVRPNFVFLGLFVGILALVISRFRQPKYLLILFFVSVVSLLPWSIYNYRSFGSFSPLPVVRGTGLSLFIASWQGQISTETLVRWGMKSEYSDEAVASGFNIQVEEIKDEVRTNLGTGESVEVLTLLDSCDSLDKKLLIESTMLHYAIKNIEDRPYAYSISVAENLVRMWNSVYALNRLSFSVRVLILTESVMISIMGLIGAFMMLYKCFRSFDLCKLALAAPVLYLLATQALLHTEARYTIPGRLSLLAGASIIFSIVVRYVFNRSIK